MDTVTQVQNLDEAVYISYCTNTVGKYMSPYFLLPATGK